ncbi:MAG: hypothetical protein ACLSH1_06215 [Clostridia bacterium]
MEAAKTNPNLMNVVEGKETLDEFVDKLPTEALIHLLGGRPVSCGRVAGITALVYGRSA